MYEIVNKVKEVIDISVIDKYIGYLVKELELDNCIFNVIIISDKEIRDINRDYRHIDKETDVISFALEDNLDYEYENFRLLGDIYISIDTCKKQAIEFNHSVMEELYFLVTHGILHLLGYDHMIESDEKEMFFLQNNLIDNYK